MFSLVSPEREEIYNDIPLGLNYHRKIIIIHLQVKLELMVEVELKKELVKQITKLLLELGSDFAFLGNQYHLELAGEDFYLDLFLYLVKFFIDNIFLYSYNKFHY